MRGALFAFLILLLLGTIIAFYYVPEMQKKESQESETEQFVKLNVDLSESGEWTSNWTVYTSTVAYNISNYGTVTADDIQVTINIDGVVFEEFSISSLASYDSFTDQFSVSVNNDSSKKVSLTASCEVSIDTATLTISAILTRTFNSTIARLYITPDDTFFQQILGNIVKNPLIPDWMEIRDWVANNIEYVDDTAAHGVSDYWQLPRETLSLRTGDCEDFSMLLCTLLRANGWDENEVYVVLGEKDGNYHAWVKLNVDITGWQNIEPQQGALNTFIGDYLSLSGYTAKYNFNDVYFKTVIS